jgi:alkanesulfonate monooxygenase SsuD/methylene tetrahydromethanopterin reductase-like flavin-dependent oxidoreductase (luciferase family)
VKISLGAPYLAPVSRATMLEWFAIADEGPFANLTMGERMIYPSLDQYVMLTAAATATERIGLMSYITILPMWATVAVAKRIASLDVVSAGRVMIAVGVGFPSDDYRAAGAPMTRRHAHLDEQVTELRRLWSGEEVFARRGPLLPRTVQPGGPKILCSARGPKSLARAGKWADGYAGHCATGSAAEFAEEAETVLAGWSGAQRPYLVSSVHYALGEDAEARIDQLWNSYYAYGFRPPISTVTSPAALEAAIAAATDAGFDELVLLPPDTDIEQVRALPGLLRSVGFA